MNILGIETSCDETAAAVIENGSCIHSNIVASSLKEHQKYGGIIPEIASRRQLECIHSVVEASLSEAELTLKDIDAVAVTEKPGLIGSLLVGQSFAQALSYGANKPLINVNHIQAHLYANFLFRKNQQKEQPDLPAIGLVVSGGHTSLFHVASFDKFNPIGQTRDDAAGEAFDKVARILGLGYPGGPAIDKIAKEGRKTDIKFNCANFPDTLDFSFSGIKTAVLYHHQKNYQNKNYSVADVAYAFQESVVKVLIQKCLQACDKYQCSNLLIGGGVAANSLFRDQLKSLKDNHSINVFYPEIGLCMDNAAMIAGLGYYLHRKF